VVQPLILQYYQLLPELIPDDTPADSEEQFRKALMKFKRSVEARYNEATLEHLLPCAEPQVRQAAVLALGMLGSIRVNASVAKALRDEDPLVRQFAVDALWAIWQRADTDENNRELQRLIRLVGDESDSDAIKAGFDALIRKSPRFAEAYNQRAIFYFQRGEYGRSIADCEKALRLNPYHYAAACGMGQCYMKQDNWRLALRIFRRANRINPHLDNIREAIMSLERMLGEEGKR